MAIFGKSGVGKTTLMRNMIVADLHAGNGITVIDPHGFLMGMPPRKAAWQVPRPAPRLSKWLPLSSRAPWGAVEA
jgi:DNA helicase HerA-like ATPase